uniref:ERF1 domain-containing protein n=1 Tax=Plectus sambesii TaxID=2011161 RepID=A0A914VJ11_9BILA
MKLLRKYIEKNGPGYASLLPEEPEDMWHAFNLIQVGDTLRSSTVRKVTTESATGTTSSQRVHTTLTIAIENVDFDASDCSLHVKGRNIEENQHVKMGAYHTLDLELNRKFELRKACWDAIHLERIDQACDPTQYAEVAAVVMQEGLAHICLLSSSMTIIRAKIDQTVPRKRKGNASQHDKGMSRFFD